MPRKIVHVVGTGTIGEPLIGLLADYRDQLGIDEVTFNKNSAVKGDTFKNKRTYLRRGARLSVDDNKIKEFKDIGVDADFDTEEAIKRASIVIDCTPSGVGHKNKEKYYHKFSDTVKGFMAQGSEHGFGKQYARGINDKALTPDDQFIQIVSCNTHNLSCIVNTLGLGGKSDNLLKDVLYAFAVLMILANLVNLFLHLR